MEEDKRSAICLKTGSIRRDYDTGHSSSFVFQKSQLVLYNKFEMHGLHTCYNIWSMSGHLAFKITESEFSENFIDLATERENKINLICDESLGNV